MRSRGHNLEMVVALLPRTLQHRPSEHTGPNEEERSITFPPLGGLLVRGWLRILPLRKTRASNPPSKPPPKRCHPRVAHQVNTTRWCLVDHLVRLRPTWQWAKGPEIQSQKQSGLHLTGKKNNTCAMGHTKEVMGSKGKKNEDVAKQRRQ